MNEYRLSASLEEHEDDVCLLTLKDCSRTQIVQVRAVVFPSAALIFTASRDTTVRRWERLADSPPIYDATISSHGSSFINAVAYLHPTFAYPDGLIFSGGKETIIEVRQPGKPPEDPAEALLLGHAQNICALDVCDEGNYVVSGSWDGTGRVWGIGKWDCNALLEGHEGSVWAVLGFDKETIITG